TRNPKSEVSQFPTGTVIARVLTDEYGRFDFANLQPGAYQIRAQVIGGTAWCDGGKIFFTRSEMAGDEIAKLKAVEFRLAPFKKGHWTTYTTRDGLPSNHIRKFWIDPDGALWIATGGGVSRFDGNQFVNLTSEDGLLSDRVYNFWRQTNGIWWFCTSRGVSRYDPKKVGQGTNAFQ